MSNHPNLFIKYQPHNNTEINLALLGKSIIGFDKTIQEIYLLSKIEGGLEIKATTISQGSIIIELLLKVGTHLPFNNTQDLLEFYRIVSPQLFDQASSFFSNFKNIHASVNDFVAKYPFDCALFGLFVQMLVGFAERHKSKPTLIDKQGKDLPERHYADGLNKIINKKKGFKLALSPFVEDEVFSIQFSSERQFKNYSEINSNSFENYFPENEQILPELNNGDVCTLTGKLVALQSSKGESLKIRVHEIEAKHSLLVVYPGAKQKAEDYVRYFNKDICFKAEVIRKSSYQKPKLKILEVSLHQLELFS